ncbi:hypothetical protein QBC34DRAFT_428973 [Podospora aff. communis PSN243]|uniref:Uncharacterized protein n=1 Tax=Podospora aff. communis PSN243 TaxID=3040156 RepID=A0AAV9GE39_9PEZI|nr:hypothetical protein QBC34DRAFT_428973 [Podospora aff. communis PSN243]
MPDHSGTSDPLGIYGGPTSDGAEISEGTNPDPSYISEVHHPVTSPPSASANMNHGRIGVDITAALISMNANNLSLLAAGSYIPSLDGVELPGDDDGSRPLFFHDGPDADPANMSPEGLTNSLLTMFDEHQTAIENNGSVTLTGEKYNRLLEIANRKAEIEGYNKAMRKPVTKWRVEAKALRERLGFVAPYNKVHSMDMVGMLTDEDIDKIFAMAFEAVDQDIRAELAAARPEPAAPASPAVAAAAPAAPSAAAAHLAAARSALVANAGNKRQRVEDPSAGPATPAASASAAACGTCGDKTGVTAEKVVLEKVRRALQGFCDSHKEMSGRVRKTDLQAVLSVVEERFAELAGRNKA